MSEIFPTILGYCTFIAKKILEGVDYVGLKIADSLGITTPKYQYYIDLAKEMQEESDEIHKYDELDRNRELIENKA